MVPIVLCMDSKTILLNLPIMFMVNCYYIENDLLNNKISCAVLKQIHNFRYNSTHTICAKTLHGSAMIFCQITQNSPALRFHQVSFRLVV